MRHIFFAVAATVALAACTGQEVRQNLGLERNAPDEFQVVTRAPLSVPPTYDLRPPRPGAQRPQEKTSEQLARQAIIGENKAKKTAAAPTTASPAENILLSKSGAATADNSIRAVLEQEQAAQTAANPLDSVLPESTALKEPIVDAQAEAKRIQDKKKQGDNTIPSSVETVVTPPEQTLWQRLKDIF